MNYRHAYHAGNFADVIKHITLSALIISLSQKETPFCYIDTHAGAGYYDLFSEFAIKNKEYSQGIEKIIQRENPPLFIKRYLHCIHQINNQLTGAKYASLRYYPGSPFIARYMMRNQDRLIACELQPQEYQLLKTFFLRDNQVSLHQMDGLLALKALLPPRERRGLVLIDPPYENPDEYKLIVRSLSTALTRWETGIFAVWYPMKEKTQVERFHRSIKENIKKSIFVIELTIYPDLPNHLNGCGLLVINPPWQFDQTMQRLIPWLWKTLTINHQGGYSLYPLK